MSSGAVAERRWTYRDLVALPDDCLRHELMDGEHIVSPSPGTRRRDKGRKRAVYEREGVGEYWIVDPDAKQVSVLRRSAGQRSFTAAATFAGSDILESPQFPGLRIPLIRVFG
jgi:Uma2 family endonuclease